MDFLEEPYGREGKNQEDLNGSEMDLLCEPDTSGLLSDLLCTPWTSCGLAVASILFCLYHIVSLGPPVAVPPSDLL